MEIKVNIPDPPKIDLNIYQKRISELEKLIYERNNKDLIDEIKSLKKILENKEVDFGPIEKRLALIEKLFGKIPDMMKPPEVKIDISPLKKALEEGIGKMKPSENTETVSAINRLSKKLDKLNLPKTLVVEDNRRQIVPYPA